MEPASIRYNNPGAMWGKGNPIAAKWGAGQTMSLNDGLGQGNNIAIFPTKVQGACAQFDLWHSSSHYHNKPLQDAIRTWSGGNSWQQYCSFLISKTPRLTMNTIINDAFLGSPDGIAMMKAQAWHEAGKEYPMSDAEWEEAQQNVFGGKKTITPVAKSTATKKTVAVGTTTVVTAGAAHQAAQSGASPLQIAIIIVVGIIIAGGLYWFIHKKG